MCRVAGPRLFPRGFNSSTSKPEVGKPAPCSRARAAAPAGARQPRSREREQSARAASAPAAPIGPCGLAAVIRSRGAPGPPSRPVRANDACPGISRAGLLRAGTWGARQRARRVHAHDTMRSCRRHRSRCSPPFGRRRGPGIGDLRGSMRRVEARHNLCSGTRPCSDGRCQGCRSGEEEAGCTKPVPPGVTASRLPCAR